ncbi:MAG: tRNA 4-thiouridine(8) synthase ThiI [Armatimonadetes bacterium]|nr:tRNA 4-thiouridine(8) synthase ThiI [Armatimonadota bacterium]MDW8120876.1 tRNA uracil 4-sulfurtransferase ThiI [Armatimonadota bacterium]
MTDTPFGTLPNDVKNAIESLDWDGVVVHYEEIGLKGHNRTPFVRALKRNMDRAVKDLGVDVRSEWDRLVLRCPSEKIKSVLEKGSRVFGVAYLAPIRFLQKDREELATAAVSYYKALAPCGSSFAVRVRRVDKTFPLTSQELERFIGARVVQETSAPVRLNDPDITISFRVYENCVYLLGPRVPGPGGLPVGTMGKVLTLFSGGIDSPVAAWLIMKRGCFTDLVHFHSFPDPQPVRSSKIPSVADALFQPQGLSARLFLVPYYPFQMALLSSPAPPHLELTLFRRFMVRVASRLADEYGHQALVTGDNLGQVASQTLENLVVTEEASPLPILRPLLTYDKNEIMTLAQRIGTYHLSTQKYKDCCSLLSRHPETKANLRAVQSAESALPLEKALDQCLSEMVIWTVGIAPPSKEELQTQVEDATTPANASATEAQS